MHIYRKAFYILYGSDIIGIRNLRGDKYKGKGDTKRINKYDNHTVTAATTAVAVSQAASGTEKAKRFGRVASFCGYSMVEKW
jgi:hypothetical protein